MKKLIVALALGLALAAPVSAGGGRTVVVGTPHVGDTFAATGCGYRHAEVSVYLYRESDAAELFGGATGTPGGCFSLTTGVVYGQPGAYEVEVFEIIGTGPGSYKHNHADAYLDFTVSP